MGEMMFLISLAGAEMLPPAAGRWGLIPGVVPAIGGRLSVQTEAKMAPRPAAGSRT